MYTNVPCKVSRSHRGLQRRFRRPAMLYTAAKYLYIHCVYIYILSPPKRPPKRRTGGEVYLVICHIN